MSIQKKRVCFLLPFIFTPSLVFSNSLLCQRVKLIQPSIFHRPAACQIARKNYDCQIISWHGSQAIDGEHSAELKIKYFNNHHWNYCQCEIIDWLEITSRCWTDSDFSNGV